MKLFSFLIFITLAHFASVGQETRINEVLIHSPSFEGNLLNDSADKYVSVYLPPSYFTDNNRRYPVVYFCMEIVAQPDLEIYCHCLVKQRYH